MFKMLMWSLVLLVIALICSEINIDTSIYKSADNSVEIKFPQWKAEDPWFYMYWTPGTLSFQYAKREKKQFESKAKDLY